MAAIERQQELLETTTKEKEAIEKKLANFKATNSSTVQELSKFLIVMHEYNRSILVVNFEGF